LFVAFNPASTSFFSEGEINFTDIFKALKDIRHKGLLNLGLSRHSHDTVNAAKQLADTSRTGGGMRLAPGRGQGHLCWWSLIA